jgi:resuscitation-promoting factor RpfB
MAMFGSDYLTDPVTQIKWGLYYINGTYGTPCAAWQNEVDYGYY